MAFLANLSNLAANAQANVLAPLLNSGQIQIFSGPQPVNANTALGSNVLLVTLTFSATAFLAASNGSITANTIAAGTAVATGTASFARMYKSDGVTVVMDYPVSTSAGGGVVLNTLAIVSGAVISLASFVHTVTEV